MIPSPSPLARALVLGGRTYDPTKVGLQPPDKLVQALAAPTQPQQPRQMVIQAPQTDLLAKALLQSGMQAENRSPIELAGNLAQVWSGKVSEDRRLKQEEERRQAEQQATMERYQQIAEAIANGGDPLAAAINSGDPELVTWGLQEQLKQKTQGRETVVVNGRLVDKATGELVADYSDAAAEPPKPYTDVAKINADENAGLITPEQAQAARAQLVSAPDAAKPQLTDIADPNDPTKTVKAWVYPDGRDPVIAGQAPTDAPPQAAPTALAKLIDERNAIFKANPNDPNLAIYDQRIAREATGDKGWSIETSPDGTVSMTQGNQGDTSSAEAVARDKAVPKMFAAMADDLPAADALAQSVGQLSSLLQGTDTGALPAFLESIRKTTGIALGADADKRQAVESLIDYLTPRMRVPGSGATSDMEMKTFRNSLPTLLGTPGGNAIIVQTLAGLTERRVRMAQIAQDYLIGAKTKEQALEEMRALPDAFAAFKSGATAAPPADTGSPPTVKSDEDYDALAPGTEFLDPEGVLRRKP